MHRTDQLHGHFINVTKAAKIKINIVRVLKTLHSIIYPLERKERKSLRDENAKVTFHWFMIVFGLSKPNFLLFNEIQLHCHFVLVIGSSHRRRAKSSLGTVLIINLLGKGLTPRACMGDGGYI